MGSLRSVETAPYSCILFQCHAEQFFCHLLAFQTHDIVLHIIPGSPANQGLPEEARYGEKAVLQIHWDSTVQPVRLGGREERGQFQVLGAVLQREGIKSAGGAITPPANSLQVFFPVAASIENSANFHGIADYDIENGIIFGFNGNCQE